MKTSFTLLLGILFCINNSLSGQTESQEKRNNIRQATLVLAETMKNSDAKKVVMAGIQSGYYPDEAILFRDLFNANSSPVFRNNTYLGNTPASSFAYVFRNILTSKQYHLGNSFPNGEGLETFLIQNKAQVYFPYSDNYNLQSQLNCAVSFDPIIENAETNGGWKFSEGRYVDVTVNETYVQSNPTLIVNFYEGNPDLPSIGTIGPGGEPDLDVSIAGGDDGCNEQPLRMSVYIEDLLFESQWDNLFAGGPDFYFCRGELVYNGDGTQISGAPNSVLVKLKRKHKGTWQNVNLLWDSRWEFVNDVFEENNQQFALYEDDESSNTSTSFSGTVGGTVKLPKLGEVSYSVNPSVTHNTTADDDIIMNTQFDRCWFISSNPINQGFGLRNSKAIRGVGGGSAVKFNMRISPF